MAEQRHIAIEKWGKRKKDVIFTIQGEVTEKQMETIYARLLKIAERYGLGADWTLSDESGWYY